MPLPYPFWDAGLSYGILMASYAVIHVFVSHFAIGGGLYLVVMERAARKAGDLRRLEYLQKLTKFFVLTTVVFGALTGVGIWFIIGLLNPVATAVLIHNFVWAWAIEWTFFVIEILAAILYFYGWKHMSAKGHMKLGWVYFWAAWMSLFVINGIVSFMLTPGNWLEDGNFWSGFFNPTFWSSVVLRTGICLMLAGLFTLFFASRYKADDFKARLIRTNALWAIGGLLLAGAAFFWYRASIPADTLLVASERLTLPSTSLHVLQVVSYTLLGVLFLVAVGMPRMYVMPLGLVMLVLGLVWFGAFEWFRESSRKPYVIHGYLYGNGLRVDYRERNTGPLLDHVRFRTGDDGHDLFRYACQHCHQIEGYIPLKSAFDGTDEAFVVATIQSLQEMKAKMPPFMGTDAEAATLGKWLWERTDKRSLSEMYPDLEGKALGEKVYEVRCSRCHELGGYNDKMPKIRDEEWELEDLEERVMEGGENEMPPFVEPENERKALLEFLAPLFTKGGE